MQTNATNNTAAFDNSVGGIVAGLDMEIAEHGRLAIFGGYGHASTSADGLNSSADADSNTLGLYGGTPAGRTAFNLGA